MHLLRRAGPAALVARKSEFVAHALPARGRAEALAAVEAVRDASFGHHVFAWRAEGGAAQGCSDDGEPRGSSGPPVLRQLQLRDVLDLVVVVQRRFGGVKLGVGGLARAYGGAAALVLDAAEFGPATALLTVSCAPSDTGVVLAAMAGLEPEVGAGGTQISAACSEGDADRIRGELEWRRGVSVSIS